MTHLIISIAVIAAFALYFGQLLISAAGITAVVAIILGIIK